MKIIAILQEDLDKLPDYTVSQPMDMPVGIIYKIKDTFHSDPRLRWCIGEKLSETKGILKQAIIVDEIFNK